MLNWTETARITARLAELADRGEAAAVATVVAIEGSAYRRPGAKLLVAPGGATLGGVSGGCLEADVVELGLAALADGRCRVRRYETAGDEPWGLGLGCDGEVEVLVQPLEGDALERWVAGLRPRLAGDARFAWATVVDGPDAGRSLAVDAGGGADGSTGDGRLDRDLAVAAAERLAAGASGLVDLAAGRVFVEVLDPPPALVVVGAGDDAIPLVRLAAGIGFRTTVVDHRPAFLTSDRFPAARTVHATTQDDAPDLPAGDDVHLVVMTHNLARDRTWVTRFLEEGVGYVGVLGPAGRRAEILDAVGDDAADRVYGPVGIDIGAEGPDQIAVSILAEVLAVRAGRRPRHLREREAPIHAPA